MGRRPALSLCRFRYADGGEKVIICLREQPGKFQVSPCTPSASYKGKATGVLKANLCSITKLALIVNLAYRTKTFAVRWSIVE